MPKLFYASPRDLPLIEPAPGLKGRVVQADHATMVIYDLAPKSIVETHKHEMEQFGVVVKGSLAMIIAGEQRILTPGDTYRIPPGAEKYLPNGLYAELRKWYYDVAHATFPWPMAAMPSVQLSSLGKPSSGAAVGPKFCCKNQTGW